jgi:(2Fe-2S) ferredoxin
MNSVVEERDIQAVAQHYVLVCQNRTCLKQGAAQVLAAFQTHPIAHWLVMGSQCMGQCGNGVMVRVLPDNLWYWRVTAEEVPTIIQQHLIAGKPVQAMLYPQFHG